MFQYIKLRPPEEVIRDNRRIHRDKSDIWLMGNILYYILTKRWIFEERLNREAVNLVLKGLRSEIPDEILQSNNPADKAMIRGIEMAWVQDPNERPTARQIAMFLKEKLAKINGNKMVDYRVSVAPLPPGYDFSTEDWYSNYKRDP